MSTITAIEPQIKNKSRFNVFIDGIFAFGADEDLVVSERLIPGKEIEKKDLEKLLYEAEVGKLMGRMYGLFSVRQRSEKEIRDYLKNLSFKRKMKDQDEISKTSIDLIIERLKQKNMLNDLEFAKAWVEGRRKSKNLGIRALKLELYQKGIDREIIEQVTGEQAEDTGSASGNSEKELAKIALEKKMRIWKNLPPLEFKKKATEFLLRKGFDYSVIKNIIDINNHYQ